MMVDFALAILAQSWQVFGQMAPYLLFGFLAAGVLSALISPVWVERHLGGAGLEPVLKASLFGVPLPLCSCSVIPVSVSIRNQGASRAATAAFLLSTPQTGVDSIAVTYALLGPVFAVFRPLAALLTGLVGGSLVRVFGESDREKTSDHSNGASCTDVCCASKERSGVMTRILTHGFVTLPRDIGLPLLIGVLIAGVLAVTVPQDSLAAYIGGGILSIVLLMAAGVPVYVCATASVPIAAGLMHLGASPGAALAFLIAGPATNAAGFTTVWKILGRKSAALYLLTVAGSALVSGILLDWLMPILETSLPQVAGHAHMQPEGGWLYHTAPLMLLAVLLYSYFPVARLGKGVEKERQNGSGAVISHRNRVGVSASDGRCCHRTDGDEDGPQEARGN